jgi:TonB family protein
MSAHWSRCAVGRAFFLLAALVAAVCASGGAQQLPPGATGRQVSFAALTERLAAELRTAAKKKPFIVGLTLPGDLPSPLGAWLADRISESLAVAHPELEVIPRSLWPGAADLEFFHDRSQQNVATIRQAQALGAEVVYVGNFAAVDHGIGITLMGNDVVTNSKMRFEALAEIPFTSDMKKILNAPLPQRTVLDGSYRASVAGIGSPTCEECPAPQYTYVARARKLTGVVVLQIWVTAKGLAENVKLVRSPHPALGDAAVRGVRQWHFRPATNVRGEFVPVIVEVAVAFKLNSLPARKAQR